jgi:coenzyme F420-0:L-glutamate ligase/coenzyme F420-1:gamma-L-glutamate ligase
MHDGAHLRLRALPRFPLVRPGDDLCALIIAALGAAAMMPRDRDVLVVAQKIVSKAEGCHVDLNTIIPSARARELANRTRKDPRLVEVILSESKGVVRAAHDVLIVEHRLGCIMANAGVDRSNIEVQPEGDTVLLLPRDPDASAAAIRDRLCEHFSCDVGVIINDSFGRAWRMGTVGVAIGVAGLPALLDQRGRVDLHGRPLRVTQIGYADEIAAAASLLMGQADEGRPAILVSGLAWSGASRPARDLIRPAERDLFR